MRNRSVNVMTLTMVLRIQPWNMTQAYINYRNLSLDIITVDVRGRNINSDHEILSESNRKTFQLDNIVSRRAKYWYLASPPGETVN